VKPWDDPAFSVALSAVRSSNVRWVKLRPRGVSARLVRSSPNNRHEATAAAFPFSADFVAEVG
jgi:hypothetical protein